MKITVLGGAGKMGCIAVQDLAGDRRVQEVVIADRDLVQARTVAETIGSAKVTIQQVDVVWIRRGSNDVKALFEVEHSTPVYSGLLRLNDIHLAAPRLDARFSVVANQERRTAFVRQVNRPTFRASGLAELCTFLEYANVYQWHGRIRSGGRSATDHVT